MRMHYKFKLLFCLFLSIPSAILLICNFAQTIEYIPEKTLSSGRHYMAGAFIPNPEIVLIWEYYCVKHIEAGEWRLARLNKKTIEWQLANREKLEISPDNITHYQQKLNKAQIAKEKAGASWKCDPPPALIELIGLNIGQWAKSEIGISFISNTPESLITEAGVALIAPECNNPQLKWLMSIPKYDLTKKSTSQFYKGESIETVPISSEGGLSDDETILYVKTTKGPGSIAHFEVLTPAHYTEKITANQFSDFKNTQTIPGAPNGDRGGDFDVKLEARLFCNGKQVDKLIYIIEQDDKDQLRQEYLDMKKITAPNREELKPYIISKHFTSKEFNSSKKVSGEKYEYILCKILDELEAVKERVGNVEMIIKSGYRNPYKNARTQGAAEESQHIYGLAVDIKLEDFNKDTKINEDDWILMAKEAKEEGACVEPIEKTHFWIHMDWRGDCPIGW